MNDISSIGNFFYNIVPGSIFLFLLNYLYKLNITDITGLTDPAAIIFIYIIFSLFLGFFFQCLTKFLRHKIWNEIVFNRVKKNNKREFNEACIQIFGDKYKEDDCIEENRAFYLMDNYLRKNIAAFLPTHFSSRHAFWSNISWDLIFLFIFKIFFPLSTNLKGNIICISLLSILLLIFSIFMAHEHLFNFYDSILKSFYMDRFEKGKLKK